MTTKRQVGERGEDIAAEFLEDLGMALVERNWRCAEGEIDIVALDGDDVVVVEVKARRGHGAGHPLEAVTPAKLLRLRRLAAAWVADHPNIGRGLRIDAVGITMCPGGITLIDHVEGVIA